jgi:hypothetical protein
MHTSTLLEIVKQKNLLISDLVYLIDHNTDLPLLVKSLRKDATLVDLLPLWKFLLVKDMKTLKDILDNLKIKDVITIIKYLKGEREVFSNLAKELIPYIEDRWRKLISNFKTPILVNEYLEYTDRIPEIIYAREAKFYDIFSGLEFIPKSLWIINSSTYNSDYVFWGSKHLFPYRSVKKLVKTFNKTLSNPLVINKKYELYCTLSFDIMTKRLCFNIDLGNLCKDNIQKKILVNTYLYREILF